MAARNTTDTKRFVFRSPDRKPTTYFISKNVSKSHELSNLSQTQALASEEVQSPASHISPSPIPQLPPTSVNTDVPTTKPVPAKRVIVVRNTNNPQVNGGSVDMGDFRQSDFSKISPVASDGVSSLSKNSNLLF